MGIPRGATLPRFIIGESDHWVIARAEVTESLFGFLPCAMVLRMKRKTARKPDGIDPKVLAAYDRWMAKHFDDLVRNYAGKYVAVYRNQLVAVGDSYKEVYAAAERLGLEEPPLTMQVPGMEDIEAILRIGRR